MNETKNRNVAVVISNEANQALEEMKDRTNQGVLAGRVNKGQLASWVLLYFHKKFFPQEIDQIRTSHRSDLDVLKIALHQLRQARRAGEPMPDIDALIAPIVDKP